MTMASSYFIASLNRTIMPLSEEQDKDYREIFDAYQKDKEANDIGECKSDQ
jgi:hypothetical protein